MIVFMCLKYEERHRRELSRYTLHQQGEKGQSQRVLSTKVQALGIVLVNMTGLVPPFAGLVAVCGTV